MGLEKNNELYIITIRNPSCDLFKTLNLVTLENQDKLFAFLTASFQKKLDGFIDSGFLSEKILEKDIAFANYLKLYEEEKVKYPDPLKYYSYRCNSDKTIFWYTCNDDKEILSDSYLPDLLETIIMRKIPTKDLWEDLAETTTLYLIIHDLDLFNNHQQGVVKRDSIPIESLKKITSSFKDIKIAVFQHIMSDNFYKLLINVKTELELINGIKRLLEPEIIAIDFITAWENYLLKGKTVNDLNNLKIFYDQFLILNNKIIRNSPESTEEKVKNLTIRFNNLYTNCLSIIHTIKDMKIIP
jgi:hypothetical protein